MKRTAAAAALVLALASPGLLAACGKKADKPRETPTAPAAPTTPPVAQPTTPTTPPATTPPTAAGEVKVVQARPAVGMQWTKVDDLTSTMVVTAGDKKLTIDTKRHFRHEHEVLAVDAAGLVTQVKASYPEHEESERRNGEAKDKVSPLKGKSYIVSVEGGEIKATLADGGAISKEELEELAADQDELGKPRVMDQIIASRTWKVGELYLLTAAELAQIAASKGARAPRASVIGFTLREVKGDLAIFDMKTTMHVEGKAQIDMEMAGSVILDTRTGRPIEVALTGPAKGKAGNFPVEGTMSGKTSYQYATP